MQSDSIVVMESGAHWPAWVDEEAGAVSNVVVLARQRGESVADFEVRARLRLDSLVALAAPRRGVLVCSPSADRDAMSCRAQLARALIAVVNRAGGGEVVIVGENDVTRELSDFTGKRKRNRRDLSQHAPVSVRFRGSPPRVEPRVA